jgi:hypothetical protein
MMTIEPFFREQSQPARSQPAAITAYPYPPSWVDRFTARIDQLPLPRWICYAGLWLAILLPYSAVKWWDGAYPVGSLNVLHMLITGTGIYILALMHHLDRMAGAALTTFRPALVVSEQGYAELYYQFTTLPARRAFWTAVIVGLWFGPTFLYNRPFFPQLQLGTSTLALGLEIVLFCFIWGVAATFVYHTLHQLRLVSRMYTEHTQINTSLAGKNLHLALADRDSAWGDHHSLLALTDLVDTARVGSTHLCPINLSQRYHQSITATRH